jgi:hypothetical protein
MKCYITLDSFLLSKPQIYAASMFGKACTTQDSCESKANVENGQLSIAVFLCWEHT